MLTVTLRLSTGHTVELELEGNTTVDALREKLAAVLGQSMAGAQDGVLLDEFDLLFVREEPTARRCSRAHRPLFLLL